MIALRPVCEVTMLQTTLLGQVVGLVRPTSGRITLSGRDPVADPA